MALSQHGVEQLYLAIAEARPDETWWQAHFSNDEEDLDGWVLVNAPTEDDVRETFEEHSLRGSTLERIVPLG